MDSNYRGKITSVCREAAKSFDMSTDGSRWKCEVTKVEISLQGTKKYRFYVHDKNSGQEYQVQATLENEGEATWNIKKVI